MGQSGAATVSCVLLLLENTNEIMDVHVLKTRCDAALLRVAVEGVFSALRVLGSVLLNRICRYHQ